MKTVEYNAQTGEITEREMTPEELAELQKPENSQALVPASVTPRQFRMSLVQKGIELSTVTAIIDSLPEPEQTLARINWEYATSFDRDNEMLNRMAPALNLSPADLDQIFINGQNL